MDDRVSTYPGRVKMVPVAGQENTYDLTMADEPTQEGTPPTKANLLTDEAANTFPSTIPTTPSEAIKLLSVGKASNPNLLINWDFRNPVNQRGASSYSSSGYSIDSWRLITGTLTINVGYITLVNAFLDEYLEGGISNSLIGKTLTLSALMSNGIIYSGTGTLSSIPAENVAVISAVSTVNGNVALIGTGVTTAPLKVRFYATPNGSSIVAVKLELGSVSTLANDPPANHGEEMLKCMTSTADVTDTYANNTIGNARIATGSYTGTGVYGVDNPNSLTFDFAPKFVWIYAYQSESFGSIIQAAGNTATIIPMSLLTTDYVSSKPPYYQNSNIQYNLSKKSADGKTLYWYCYYLELSATCQLNHSGYVYYYIALG